MKVRKKPRQETVESQLDQLVTLADRVWREQLAELEHAAETTGAAWRLENARLAARFGADSERAKSAALLGSAHAATRAEIEAERDRLRAPSPRPQPGSAVLHGRVTDPSGKGLAGLTLRIVDEEGKIVGKGRTTPGGHYRVMLPLADEAQVFVEIAGRGGARLQDDEQPTIAAPGGMLFREIVVDPHITTRSRRATARRVAKVSRARGRKGRR